MAVSEQQKKADTRFFNIFCASTVFVILAYFGGYAGSLSETEGIPFFSCFRLVWENIKEFHLFYPWNSTVFLVLILSLMVSLIIYVLLDLDSKRHYAYSKEKSNGTGGFMSDKEKKEYDEKYVAPAESYKDPVTGEPDKDADTNMILSNTFYRSMNDMKTWKNNNVLVFGGAGTGKSRFVIKPNILQLNASYVITDPSGELLTGLGNVLVDHGYVIKILNISDMEHSNRYNPFAYIRNEAGVLMLIDCLIANTSKAESAGDNQFFVDAEKVLYAACIFYLRDEAQDKKKQNFSCVLDMISMSLVDESGKSNQKSPLDMVFESIKNKETSLAWKYYSEFKQGGARTLKSVIMSCIVRLQYFQIPQVRNLTSADELDLGSIGDRKTALFLIIPQADRTYSFLSAMLYAQLFETLYNIGESRQREGGSPRMKYPVRCMMDEFKNSGKVPEFPEKLSTMRKYNISCTVILQDKSQIEAMYEKEWKTITANCDNRIFLGSNEPETLKYMEEMLGNQTIITMSRSSSQGKGHSSQSYQSTKREVMTAEELGRLPTDECIVFTGSGKLKDGIRPVRDKKYKYENHPLYKLTADGEGELYAYHKMSIYNTSANAKVSDSLIDSMNIISKTPKSLVAVESEDLNFDSLDNLLNSIQIEDESIEDAIFARIVMEIKDKLDTYKKQVPLCTIGTVKSFPPKLLQKGARNACMELGLPRLIVFADNKGVYLQGAGVGIEDDIMDKFKIYFDSKDKESFRKDSNSDETYDFIVKKENMFNFQKCVNS